MFKSAVYTEPFLNTLESRPIQNPETPKIIPKSLQRKKPLNIPNLDETQIIRHFHHLSQMNFGVDTGIYPLGSCTMKYNPRLNEFIANWEEFSNLHPYQDESTVQGTLQMMYELEQMLKEITGMHAFSLQPAAGAHGEFLGMLL
ncbi:MAG: aminomethyl-transferring glycine dehydrogenase subunit GcvPB, partial [Promethearchaeota archaeon]